MWIEPGHPFWLSLRVAITATALCALIGAPLAYWLSRTRRRFAAAIELVILMPIVLPPTVVGYALIVALGRHGFPGAILEQLNIPALFTWRGAVIAATTVSLPLAVLPIKAAFESIDRELEELAAVQGLGRLGILWHVTIPLARRGLAAGLLLAFARALGEFGATLMVAGNIPGRTQTLPLAIYHAWQTGRDEAAIGPILILTSVAIMVIALQRLLLRSK